MSGSSPSPELSGCIDDYLFMELPKPQRNVVTYRLNRLVSPSLKRKTNVGLRVRRCLSFGDVTPAKEEDLDVDAIVSKSHKDDITPSTAPVSVPTQSKQQNLPIWRRLNTMNQFAPVSKRQNRDVFDISEDPDLEKGTRPRIKQPQARKRTSDRRVAGPANKAAKATKAPAPIYRTSVIDEDAAPDKSTIMAKFLRSVPNPDPYSMDKMED